MSSRCEIRIRTSSFKDLPQPSLDSGIIKALQNGGLSKEEIDYLKKTLASNKKASAQLQFYVNLYRQREQRNKKRLIK